MMMLVNLLGILLIAGIVWWFWVYKPKSKEASDGVQIIVVENGVYAPARINLESGKATNISFMRKDQSPCAGTVVFSALDISEELPVGKIKTIHIPKLDSGTYTFGCQMEMYRGELVVN